MRIAQERSGVCISHLCLAAEVSRKCYSEYLKRSLEGSKNAVLIEKITAIQLDTRYALGYRQMTIRLKLDGIAVNHKKVLRIMKEYSLLSHVRRKSHSQRWYAARKEISGSLPKNLIKRHFFCGQPAKKFLMDITYLPCLEGTLYMNIIMDLFNKEIVSFRISKHPDAQLLMQCMYYLKERISLYQCIFHTDQGSVYMANVYRIFLYENGACQSMSNRGQCWDNAPMESFNSILKSEGLYTHFSKKDINNHQISGRRISGIVEDYITYYNQVRRKQELGNLSPTAFRMANPLGTLPVMYTGR